MSTLTIPQTPTLTIQPPTMPMPVYVSTDSGQANAIDQLKERLAGQCGLDPQAIMSSRLAQYDLLLSQGLGIRLRIGGSTLFCCSLDYRFLGLALSDQEHKLHDEHVDLGDFFLAPREVVRGFANLANQARNYLRRKVARTIGFEFEPGWIWTPITENGDKGFRQVNAHLEEYRAAYLEYVRLVADNIELYKAQTLEAVEEAAPLIYSRLGGEAEQTPDDFVQELEALVRAKLPTAEAVRSRAYFYVEYKAYPMPSQLAADKAVAAQLELEAEKAESETRLVQARLWAEEQAAKEAARSRQQMLLDVQRRYLEEERRRKEEVLDPMIREIAGRIQGLVAEVTGSVTRTLAKGDRLPAPTVARIRGMVEDLGPLLGLVGDVRLEQLAAKLNALTTPGGVPQAQAIAGALDRLGEAATARVAQLGPSLFEYLEI